MMAFAPPKNIGGPKMQTKMSTWTPLNHQLLNNQILFPYRLLQNIEYSSQRYTVGPCRVFEERRALLGKWFDKWTDSQRRRILTGLLERCSLSQQKFCCRKLQEKIPAEALDFTTTLPRVLSLYIFSFLDPRSLCRCAQGIWKKHYIQMVKELHVTKPKTPPKDGFVIADVQPVTSSSPSSAFRSSSSLRKKNHPGEKELPPWRSSDKHPTDIIRFNYLDNCDPIEQSWQGRRKRHEMTPDFNRQSRDKKNKSQDRSKLRKAQSLKQSKLGGKESTLFVGVTWRGDQTVCAAFWAHRQTEDSRGPLHRIPRWKSPGSSSILGVKHPLN
ncbi:F-box only protein 16 isoform X4 [Kogia breviceps]|uniref:F-box only protein 16 isoform X4 n=1 Tax=Kogia breviceps TaxID=27615 RepID=UPI0034D17180